MIDVPRALLWDYPEAPSDPEWRLVRVAEFFPHYGRDRKTVAELFASRAQLHVPREIVELIELYELAYRARDRAG